MSSRNFMESCSSFSLRLILSFILLCKHRFGSHVCEELLLAAERYLKVDAQAAYDTEGVFLSAENLILFMASELRPDVMNLMTDTFGSHIVRLLSSILAKPRTEGSNPKVVKRPIAFTQALLELLKDLSGRLSYENLQYFALHKNGCPTLCAFLDAEQSLSLQDPSLRHHLVPRNSKDGLTEEKYSYFISKAMHDRIGSYLIETLIRVANDQEIHSWYARFFTGNFTSFAREETTTFVCSKFLDRVNDHALAENICEEFLPGLAKVAKFSRMALLRSFLEMSVRCELDLGLIERAIRTIFDCNTSMVNLISSLVPIAVDMNAVRNESLQGSLLAQSLLQTDSRFSEMIVDSVIDQPIDILNNMAEDSICSRIIECLMRRPNLTKIQRRKVLNRFFGKYASLSLLPSGSRVVDASWDCAKGLNHYKAKIADELLAREVDMKDSKYGKIVWRNWRMELYRFKRDVWWRDIVEKEEMAKELSPEATKNFGSKAKRSQEPEEMSNSRRKLR